MAARAFAAWPEHQEDQQFTGGATADAAAREAVDHLAVCALVLGPSGEVVWRNPAAARLLGPGCTSLGAAGSLPDGIELLDLAGNPLPSSSRPWTRCRITKAEAGAVIGWRAPGRSTMWLDVRARALATPGPAEGALVVEIRDVTADHVANAERDRRLAELSEANELKTGLAAATSHELRTPLTSLLGALDTLQHVWDDLDEDTRLEMINAARRSGGRLQRITDDLFGLAQAEAHALRIEPEVIDLGDLVARVVGDLPFASSVLVDVAAGMQVLVDVGHAERILRNLLSNAERYGAPPFRVAAAMGRDAVEIRVSDEGLGVAAEFVPRLFEKFSRNAARTSDGSSGLGLAIVKALAHANAGDVVFEPSERGARFCVTLPTPSATAVRAPKPAAAQARPTDDAVPASAAADIEASLLAAPTTSLVEWEYQPVTDRLVAIGPVAEMLGVAAGADTQDALRTALGPIIAVIKGGATWEKYELEVAKPNDPDGTGSRLLARATQRRDGFVTGVLLDVSDGLVNAERLAELADRYQLLVELSPDMVVVHEQGLVRYVNRTGLRILGARTPGEVVGRRITDFVHPSSIAPLMERLRGLEAPGDVSTPSEIWLFRLDGSEVAFESTSVRTTWEGRPAFQVFLRDLTARRQAEAAVRYQAGLVAAVSDAIVATGPDGRVRSWNPAAERLYGVSAADAIDRPLGELLGAAAVDAGGHVVPGDVVHRRADGTLLDVEVSTAEVPGERGVSTGEVAVCADRTERRRAAAEREHAAQRISAVVTALNDAIVVFEADGSVSMVNDAAHRLLGPAASTGSWRQMAAAARLRFGDGSRLPLRDHPVAKAMRTGENQRDLVVGYTGPEGEQRWASLNCQVLPPDPVTGQRAVVCSFTDVTERRAAQARLRHEATHDSLTGLPNRPHLVRSFQGLLARIEMGKSPAGAVVAALFIDLDRFKTINDAHGHRVGDQVLVEVANRMRAAAPEDGIVGRLAGDEFVSIVVGFDEDEVMAHAARLRAVLGRPIRLASAGEVSVTASVGLVFADQSRSAEELLRDADLAMYEAKRLGRARVEVFDPPLRDAAQRRSDIAGRLNHAIASNGLTVAYQPILSLATGQVEGAEALVRWTDSILGPVSPAEFIPVAEDHGLVAELGRIVMSEACREAASRSVHGKISVNLSTRQLNDPSLTGDVRRALRESGLDPDRLWFEVTESALMENVDRIHAVLADLGSLGVHFSIDDFGTGYSSLSYLRRLPVEALKIDRSFVAGIGIAEDEAIVAAVIDLAHRLGRKVIAEGVETPAQLSWLESAGCDSVQGFFTGRPAPSFPLP